MDKERRKIAALIKKAEPDRLRALLVAAYDEMNYSQRYQVFGELLREAKPSKVDGSRLLREIEKFYKESLKGVFYAPFDMNSKNFMHVPVETEKWFDRIGEMLEDATRLSHQHDHKIASLCFKRLYELIDVMNNQDGIVFADELGSWMISGDSRVYMEAYAASLAARMPRKTWVFNPQAGGKKFRT